MSSSLAIAAVTEILVEQSRAALNQDLGLIGADLVTVGPPQLMREGRRDSQLNLFLYQVITDAAWRNQDIPGLTKPGELAAPLLAIRLGFLLTTFGENDSDRVAHQMLGSVMLKFHNEPVLPRDSATPVIADSRIANQVEPVRLTQQPMALDEMSKLWSGFQFPYRLSVAYEATVVLIDSGKPTRSAPPVLSRGDDKDSGFVAQPLVGEPVLEGLKFPPSQPGCRFAKPAVITGQNLDVAGLHLVFRHPRLSQGLVARPKPSVTRTSKEIRSLIPTDWDVFREDPHKTAQDLDRVNPDPANWPSGVYTVSAARVANLDAPATDPLRLLTTTHIPFVLFPIIDISAGRPTLVVTRSGSQVTVARLEIKLTAPLHRNAAGNVDQNVKLFAGDFELVGNFSFTATDNKKITWTTANSAAAAVVAELKRRPADSLFVRVQIDGVDSSMLVPATPATGQAEEAQKREFDPELLLQLL